MKILIIKLGAIGDVLRSISLIEPLKKKHDPCQIDWVTKKNAVDLLKNNPQINNLYVIDDQSEHPAYDLVINFDDEQAACDLATKVQKKELIGAYSKSGNRVYTPNTVSWFDMGLISRFGKEKADKLKAKNQRTYQDIHFTILDLKNPQQYPPNIFLNGSNKQFAETFSKKNAIDKNKTIVGVNTGAGGRWEDKKLTVKQTVHILDELSKDNNIQIVLFGGPEEIERNHEILEQTSGVIDAGCNNSLLDFASLVDICDILLTSDSLAMHVGIACKKNIVAFFYPTSAQEIELYGKGKKIIGEGTDYCSYKPKCDDPPKWDLNEIIKAIRSYLK